MTRLQSLLVLTVLLFFSCGRENNSIDPGGDPNFIIVAHSDSGFTKTNRKVEVFNIPIYAYKQVPDEKLLHAANIMAQYLDNDEDGVVDNSNVYDALLDNNAALFMWKKQSQITIDAQDLGSDETVIDWHMNGQTGRFDASLEEVWHVISHSGYSQAYPEVFGEQQGSSLASAMDLARGGLFENIPNEYPENAWYTYDDHTCEYDCMVTEYFYWALTSILGGQSNRFDEISHEWKLNTKELVMEMDPEVYALLTNPEYNFPTVLPDGTYRH